MPEIGIFVLEKNVWQKDIFLHNEITLPFIIGKVYFMWDLLDLIFGDTAEIILFGLVSGEVKALFSESLSVTE